LNPRDRGEEGGTSPQKNQGATIAPRKLVVFDTPFSLFRHNYGFGQVGGPVGLQALRRFRSSEDGPHRRLGRKIDCRLGEEFLFVALHRTVRPQRVSVDGRRGPTLRASWSAVSARGGENELAVTNSALLFRPCRGWPWSRGKSLVLTQRRSP